MYLDDHGTPHCHGIYGDYAGSFSLENGKLLPRQMPPKQQKKIEEFIRQNQFELIESWNELST